MKESKFPILKNVKNVEASNVPFSLSIGIGSGENLNETEEFAKSALDLALGRGGDQVVIRENNDYTYFGGNKKEIRRCEKIIRIRKK